VVALLLVVVVEGGHQENPTALAVFFLGKLEVTPEGWLKGHGHPDDWFDAVCKDK
jgi:hypothetical protein